MKEKKFCVLLWPELPADVARPDAELRQLHYPQPHVVGQGPPVDEDSAELVDLPVRVDMRRLWTNQKLISLDFLSSRCWLLGPFGVAGHSLVITSRSDYISGEISARFATLISQLLDLSDE